MGAHPKDGTHKQETRAELHVFLLASRLCWAPLLTGYSRKGRRATVGSMEMRIEFVGDETAVKARLELLQSAEL